MIQVLRVPLSKEQLRALSKEERALFFLLGYVSNQISMFQKLITFATNKTPNRSTSHPAMPRRVQYLRELRGRKLSTGEQARFRR